MEEEEGEESFWQGEIATNSSIVMHAESSVCEPWKEFCKKRGEECLLEGDDQMIVKEFNFLGCVLILAGNGG